MDALRSELPQTRHITLGGGAAQPTKIFLKPEHPLVIDGEEIRELTIRGGNASDATGAESARPMTRRASSWICSWFW